MSFPHIYSGIITALKDACFEEMVTMRMDGAKKGLYMGIGAGIVLFAISGVLSGSFIGGAIGVHIAKSLAGNTLGTSLIPRIIIGVSMVFGVLLSGLFFLISTSSLGWLVGCLIDSSRSRKAVSRDALVDPEMME